MAYNEMMQDPRFQQMIQEIAQKKKKKSLLDMLDGGGSHQELAAIFPKMQAYMEQRKIKDLKDKAMLAQQKIKQTQEDQLYKRAEQAYNMQQQQQQMQAAQNSV